MNGVRKKNQKTILDATFEESRKLVDESYVEEALKVSSNKQDRNRFWGEVVTILVGTIFSTKSQAISRNYLIFINK